MREVAAVEEEGLRNYLHTEDENIDIVVDTFVDVVVAGRNHFDRRVVLFDIVGTADIVGTDVAAAVAEMQDFA